MKEPGQLYHDTDFQALDGIVQGGQHRFNNVLNMNDGWISRLFQRDRLSESYREALSLLQTKGTFPLPDLSDCALPAGQCSCMTPQGICATKKYILVTAYCNIKRFKRELKAAADRKEKAGHGEKTGPELPEKGAAGSLRVGIRYEQIKNEPVHPSCLYVFSKKNYRPIAVLELPDINHVGGIAYDGAYLWIAKSTSQALSVIRERDLEDTLKAMRAKRGKKQTSAAIGYYQEKIPCGMTASFVTVHEGRVWVGYCAPAGRKGFLQAFDVQKTRPSRKEADGLKEMKQNISECKKDKKIQFSLIPKEKIQIPGKANGASFFDLAAHKESFLFLSLSGGRRKPSSMIIYQVTDGRRKNRGSRAVRSAYDHQRASKVSDIRIKRKRRIHPLPPLLEESCIDGGILYTLYESSSPAYRDVPGNQCDFPVDVVCMADPAALVSAR